MLVKGIVLCSKKEKKKKRTVLQTAKGSMRSEQVKSGKYNSEDFKDWIFVGPSDAFVKAEAPSLLCTG